MKHTVYEHHWVGGASGLVIDVPGSDVVNIEVRFNSGYAFAKRSRYEVPHVMEHLLASVTQGHPGPNEFSIDVSKNGAYSNAFTSMDTNGYLYECAKFEQERIFNLLEEQITRPLFAPTALKAELGNVREELSRNLSQHSSVCSVALGVKSFPKLWMGYEDRIAQLDKITVADVKNHYVRTHTASNARVCVAGSFPDGGAAVATRLGKLFRQMPQGTRFERTDEPGLGLEKPIITHRDIPQLYYQALLFFGEISAAERRALTLLRLVLVGGMGSLIYGEARRRGLAYSIGTVGSAQRGSSSFGFVGHVSLANAEELFGLLSRGMQTVLAGGVSQKMLDAAKNLGIGSIQRSTQTPGDLMHWYVDPYDELGEIRDFDHTLELLRDVTIADVTAIASKAAQGGRLGVSLLGDIDEAKAAQYQECLRPMVG